MRVSPHSIPRMARQVVTAALTAVLLLPSPALVFAQAVTPRIVTYELPTGQMLYIKEDRSQPIVTIDTWVKTGSVNETERINGVSHFLEHLLFKGTEKYGTGEIDRILESRGAEFNAATSDDFTHYYITTATPYWEEAVSLHADMLLNATIPVPELTRERKVVQEEINRATDNPQRQMFIAMNELLYGNHGYALDTLGPKETIGSVPREDILAYYHYWYQPENFNTVIVGDVDPERVKQVVAQAFPKPPFTAPKQYTPPPVGKPTPPAKPQSKAMTNPNVSQAYFALAMLGPSLENPKDAYALDIAMLALGSGKSSRLYQALREQKPLATSVSAGNYTQKHSGLLFVTAEMQPGNREAVKQEIMTQLKRLKAQGITEEELKKAKTQYLNNFIFENETTDGVAQSIGYHVTLGSLQSYLDHVSNVEGVTLDQVDAALEQYLDFDSAVAVELMPNADAKALAAAERANLALLQKASQPEPAGTRNQPSADEAKAPITITRTVLPNGLTLISKPLDDSATVAVKVFVKGGIGAEFVPGTATMTASTLMQGTAARSAEAISRELERRGMSLAVSADEDYIEVSGAAIQKDLGELLVILQDVLTRPAFEQAEIDKKKEQLRQAIAANRDTPSSIAFENLSLALYPMHPYGNVGKRVEDHLNLVTRQEILDYYHRYFQPENMVVTVVGNFDPAMVQNTFHALYPASMQKPCPSPATGEPRAQDAASAGVPEVPPLEEEKVVEAVKSQLAAVWMAQGWLAPAIDSVDDYVALKVLNSLVGAGMSSRLFVDLREKQGLAYVVGSFFPTRQEDSRFVMYIGTDPVNTDKVRAGFTDEIKRLQAEAITERELAEAKSKLIGSYALSHDTNSTQAFYLGLYETLGAGYGFDRRYPELIEQVTADDIQRVAKKYFSRPGVVSIVKPASQNPE